MIENSNDIVSMLSFPSIKILKGNAVLKLLNADNSPLIISFLYKTFKRSDLKFHISIPTNILVSLLYDYFTHLEREYGEKYPNEPLYYLENWVENEFMTRYYPVNSDEPVFELTPSTEKVFEWIQNLEKREFVGVESRLSNIFKDLKEITIENSDDVNIRLNYLESERERIDTEIRGIKSGVLPEKPLDTVKVRERYLNIIDNIHRIFSDFSQIKHNFINKTREIRENQISGTKTKSEMLDYIFSDQNQLSESPQGRSWISFFDLLMNTPKQKELNALIGMAVNLPEIEDISNSGDLIDFINHAILYGDQVNSTYQDLNEDLKKYLESGVYFENKHVLEVIGDIKSLALKIKNTPDGIVKDYIIEIPHKMDFDLIMSRPIWDFVEVIDYRTGKIESGSIGEVDFEKLYPKYDIDRELLSHHIDEIGTMVPEFTLNTIFEKYPVELGIEEVIGYLGIVHSDKRLKIMSMDDQLTSVIWDRVENTKREIRYPHEVFRSELYGQ